MQPAGRAALGAAPAVVGCAPRGRVPGRRDDAEPETLLSIPSAVQPEPVPDAPRQEPADRGGDRWPSPAARGYLLLALTPLLPLLVALPGGRWALPLVAPLTVYGWFRRRVRAGDYPGAWRLGLLWAALLSLGVIAMTQLLPEVAAGILGGEPYRAEMFQWVETGVGRENELAAFLPQHLLHLGVFLLLTWVSAGYLGLSLGTVLVAYMSYFVGSYAAAAGHPLVGSLAAWVPWSVLRVAAFVLLGTVFARPLLVRRVWPFGQREAILMALAASGIVGDVVIKALLAPAYGLLLRQLAGGSL